MKIEFQSVSKRFAYEWIFRDLNYTINASDKIGVIGPNGSGKSTLIRVLLGTIDPSQGKMAFAQNNKVISVNDLYSRVSFTAPYMGIPDNMTIEELLKFHFKFKKPKEGISLSEIPKLAYLDNNKHKLIRQFSSGMKQRFKLALAMCTQSDLLVLDEPTTNLDVEGKQWFQDTLEKYLDKRSLVIATNETDDLKLVDKKLNILDFKKKS